MRNLGKQKPEFGGHDIMNRITIDNSFDVFLLEARAQSSLAAGPLKVPGNRRCWWRGRPEVPAGQQPGTTPGYTAPTSWSWAER